MAGSGKTRDEGDELTVADPASCHVSPPCEESRGEEHFRSIFEHAAVGMELVAVDGRLLMVNAALCHMLGYSKSELLGKTSEQITHPEDRDRETPLLESMLRGERESYEVEKRYLHRNGSPIWANSTCSPTTDAAGKTLYRISIVQDITARKRTEAALSESESAFATLSNFVPQLVWICTSDGLNIYFNQRWVDYTGLTLEESYGKGWNTPFHPDDKQPAWDAWNHAVQTGEQYCIESRLRAADGTYRWFLIRGVPMCQAPGGVPRWFGTCTDIEDLKQKSEGRFRSVLDNSRDVIYSVNLETERYEYISPSAAAVVGYSPDALMAQDIEASLAMVHPDDLPTVRAALARSKDLGEAEMEYRQRTKDGNYRWMSNRMSLIRDDAGRPHYRDGNIRDITEQKRYEEERETTIEFLGLVNRSRGTRDLIEGAATFFQERSGCEAVGIRLREGDDYPYFEARGFSEKFVIAENKLCVRGTLGMVLRDNLGSPILECMCGSVIGGRFDPSKPFFTTQGCFWTNSTSELLASTTEDDRQSRTRNRCNGEGYESVALIPLRDGEERFGLLQLNDRRKGRFSAEVIALWERLARYLATALCKFRTEEALRQSEAQFRTLADSIPQLAWMANADGWIFWYNQRWYSYTGTTSDQMEGWGWQSVHDPDQLPEVLERWKGSIANGEPFDMVFPLRGADGVFRPFLTRIMPLFDAQGRVVRWFGTNTDVSAQKQAEQALLRSEKLASVGRMAATIAHEINNPLAAVTNLLFVAKSLDDAESIRQYLSIADAELQRIAHITRQSLGFYREFNAPALTSLNALMESAIDLLKNKINAKHAVIEKQWDREVQITAVAGELRQVFSNLLANSLDAIGEKGIIKVRVSAGKASSNNQRFARVTIADSGQGISTASRQHIFEPFFTTKGAVGTGLGLWVSKQIVDKHGGSIRIRSHTNGTRTGTVFSVVLPVNPAGAVNQAVLHKTARRSV